MGVAPSISSTLNVVRLVVANGISPAFQISGNSKHSAGICYRCASVGFVAVLLHISKTDD